MGPEECKARRPCPQTSGPHPRVQALPLVLRPGEGRKGLCRDGEDNKRGKRVGDHRAGAHLPSTLHLRLQRDPPEPPEAREGRRVKLRHFPPSQLKPRHRTSCSLLTQGDSRTRKYDLGPHAHPELAQAPKGKRTECGKVGVKHNMGEGLERAPPSPTEGANF